MHMLLWILCILTMVLSINDTLTEWRVAVDAAVTQLRASGAILCDSDRSVILSLHGRLLHVLEGLPHTPSATVAHVSEIGTAWLDFRALAVSLGN